MKKSRIGGKQYLDYLWELGELLVYTIGGFGVSVSLRYNCPYVVRIRGSSELMSIIKKSVIFFSCAIPREPKRKDLNGTSKRY